MTKSDLSQLKYLNKEIEQLKRDIDNASIPITMTRDSVKGSSRYFPYCERIFGIAGVDYAGYDRKVARLKKQLQSRIDELMDKVVEINEYIASVEDSETRIILQLRYINGLTLEEIGREMGMHKKTVERKFQNWWGT